MENYPTETSDYATIIQDFLDYDESVTANPYFGDFLPTESFFSQIFDQNQYEPEETTDFPILSTSSTKSLGRYEIVRFFRIIKMAG